MPTKVNTVGLEMPDDFPADAYNAVHAAVGAKPRPPGPMAEWAGAWNAVAWRFMSLADNDAAFTDNVRRTGGGRTPSERYLQERELFSFFVTGLSTIESFCYGLYAVASMIDSANFPLATFKEKRGVK